VIIRRAALFAIVTSAVMAALLGPPSGASLPRRLARTAAPVTRAETADPRRPTRAGGGGPACRIVASGAVVWSSTCTVLGFVDRDAGFVAYTLVTSASASTSASVLLVFDAPPRVGPQFATFWSDAGTYFANVTIAQNRAEWEARAGISGRVDLTVTSVRRQRDGGLEAWEVHGALDAKLMPSNIPQSAGSVDVSATF
jgi:hypothetical protein